ncbi:hypothetical protein J6590_033849 [Homalodisca vitripennis]|nr:hypothetical protein J6590_033849 [Homalodisca vitripennis]
MLYVHTFVISTSRFMVASKLWYASAIKRFKESVLIFSPKSNKVPPEESIILHSVRSHNKDQPYMGEDNSVRENNEYPDGGKIGLEPTAFESNPI